MDYKKLRSEMVEDQIAQRGIKNSRVLEAFRQVERENFVPDNQKPHAYEDRPLPIGLKQTISQPYIVALMTEALQLVGKEKVLEIGTGSGYQTAILAQLAREVYSIERLPELAESAHKLLHSLKIANVRIKTGDGTLGYEEEAPFDRIIITAAAPEVPQTLVEQLREGGRIVYPRGELFGQEVAQKENGELKAERLCGCVFVPLIGKYGIKNG
ncbi:MAG: protein-L-isoaspartate(D-aspartate) O-methyltransferase [Candidatus Omnitrophica bacterium]|nr:protein-L-isoaspartate(D-aspartate) O-methyltransferase [Candidatus Omnitrophota bacterium]